MTIFILSLIIFLLLLLTIILVIREITHNERTYVNKETGEKIQVLYDATVKRPNTLLTFDGVVYYYLDFFDVPYVMEIEEFRSTFIRLKEWKRMQKTE